MLTVPRPTQFRDTKEGKSMIREGKDITYWWRKEGQRQEDKPLNREERSYSPTTLGDFTLSDMIVTMTRAHSPLSQLPLSSTAFHFLNLYSPFT